MQISLYIYVSDICRYVAEECSVYLLTLQTSHLYLLTVYVRPAICIFYLVLRALDTVEDDMHIPVGQKTAMLKEFHTHLHDPNWTFMDSTEDDKVVLEEFYVVGHTCKSNCSLPVSIIPSHVLML